MVNPQNFNNNQYISETQGNYQNLPYQPKMNIASNNPNMIPNNNVINSQSNLN